MATGHGLVEDYIIVIQFNDILNTRHKLRKTNACIKLVILRGVFYGLDGALQPLDDRATNPNDLQSILSQRASFVKNHNLNPTADINSRWRDAENLFLFQSLDCECYTS